MSSPDSQRAMISEIAADSASIESLLRDQFANYVVQTAVCFAKEFHWSHLILYSLSMARKTFRIVSGT